jgi:hypothetical protein
MSRKVEILFTHSSGDIVSTTPKRFGCFLEFSIHNGKIHAIVELEDGRVSLLLTQMIRFVTSDDSFFLILNYER